jgi:hypothetical protein
VISKIGKTLLAVAALSISVGSCLPASADAWVANNTIAPNGTMIASIVEGADYQGVSRRISHVDNADGTFDEFLCADGPATGGCAKPESNAILPVCQTELQTDCIEGLKFGTIESEMSSAKLVREVAGQTYPALGAFGGLPAGGTISIWDAPGLSHGGGTTKYAVQVNEVSNFDSASGVFITSQISASIFPISDRIGLSYKTSKLTETENNNGRTRVGGWEFAAGCAVTEASYCGVTEDFTANSRFTLAIRASNQITGWFKGRIQKPTVTIDKYSDSNNRITMTAEPVTVARLAALVTPENTSTKGKELLVSAMNSGTSDMFKGDSFRHTQPDNQNSLTWIDEFRVAAQDRAAGVSTLWNFATLSGGGEQNRCFADKSRVVGVVTTNATALAIGAPEFSNNMLDYKVAGLHYAPDGKTLNEGTYDLVMRSDVARCLYGFTKAPISARISVVGEGGENKVATTVVSEKDGWLKMAAYGFSFSSPTISVKLNQVKPVAAKKTTITCVSTKNKKLTKKVTAVGPKCPSGYKKK